MWYLEYYLPLCLHTLLVTEDFSELDSYIFCVLNSVLISCGMYLITNGMFINSGRNWYRKKLL
jgi:hypothetical protein